MGEKDCMLHKNKWDKNKNKKQNLTTPDFKEAICGPLEVPPYRQTDFKPHGFPASHKTSAICTKMDSHATTTLIKKNLFKWVEYKARNSCCRNTKLSEHHEVSRWFWRLHYSEIDELQGIQQTCRTLTVNKNNYKKYI